MSLRDVAEQALRALQVVDAMQPGLNAVTTAITDLERELAPHRWPKSTTMDETVCPSCQEPIPLDDWGHPAGACEKCRAQFDWKGMSYDDGRRHFFLDQIRPPSVR